MEKRHITENDYLKIIDICEQILRGGDFEKLRQKLYELFISIIELQPFPPIPPLGIFGNKKKTEMEIRKSRETLLLNIIEAAKIQNNKRLVYLFSKLK